MNNAANWSGQTWQQHINELLHIHHLLFNSNYFEVPDKVNGDGGLEGFSSNGHAYQCYCDEGSQATAERVTKQKDKITQDLKKLDTYQDFWKKTLRDIKIRMWHLVVPVVEDKDVLRHARAKAAETKKLGLSFLHQKFDAKVCTDSSFSEAYMRVMNDAPATIKVCAEAVDSSHVASFEAAQTAFVSNIDRKIQLLASHRPPETKLDLRRQFLDYHLRGSNILSKIQHDAPPLWEKLTAFLQEQEAAIRIESTISQDGAGPRLTATRGLLETKLAKVAPKLDQGHILTLSWSTVAGWLGECPLDF
jgi:hypothetical protein